MDCAESECGCLRRTTIIDRARESIVALSIPRRIQVWEALAIARNGRRGTLFIEPVVSMLTARRRKNDPQADTSIGSHDWSPIRTA